MFMHNLQYLKILFSFSTKKPSKAYNIRQAKKKDGSLSSSLGQLSFSSSSTGYIKHIIKVVPRIPQTHF